MEGFRQIQPATAHGEQVFQIHVIGQGHRIVRLGGEQFPQLAGGHGILATLDGHIRGKRFHLFGGITDRLELLEGLLGSDQITRLGERPPIKGQRRSVLGTQVQGGLQIFAGVGVIFLGQAHAAQFGTQAGVIGGIRNRLDEMQGGQAVLLVAERLPGDLVMVHGDEGLARPGCGHPSNRTHQANRRGQHGGSTGIAGQELPHFLLRREAMPEFLRNLGRRGRPIVGFERQTLLDEPGQATGHVGVQFPDRPHADLLAGQDVACHLAHRARLREPAKRMHAGQQFVQHDAERENVAPLIHHARLVGGGRGPDVFQVFRRHVGQRAAQSRFAVAGVGRQVEVQQPRLAVEAQQHVRGLQVVVHEPGLMHGREGVSHPGADPDDAVDERGLAKERVRHQAHRFGIVRLTIAAGRLEDD